MIFTKNTTQSLKIIAESIQWDQQFGHFCYLRQSHTSILGMREFVPLDRVHPVEADALNSSDVDNAESFTNDASNFNVFVFPAQCNFSGERYPLSWIRKVKRGCLSEIVQNKFPWIVVLDAASYLTTTPLNLYEFPVDFVVFSFYKLFGFPTSIGALVGTSDALFLLKKRYYGGGTVASIAWDSPWKILKNTTEIFEDGTLPFLEIMAIDHGYDFIESIGGWKIVQNHVYGLANMALQGIIPYLLK